MKLVSQLATSYIRSSMSQRFTYVLLWLPRLLYRLLMCQGRRLRSSAESSNISVLLAEGSCKLLGGLQLLFGV